MPHHFLGQIRHSFTFGLFFRSYISKILNYIDAICQGCSAMCETKPRDTRPMVQLGKTFLSTLFTLSALTRILQ